MMKVSIFAIAVAMLGLATPAQAGTWGQPCTSAPQNKWLSLTALEKRVAAQGYKVQKSKMKDTCGEIYTLDKDGKRVELFVDPTNGKIVGQY
jgi:hypothetical protein